LPTRALLTDYYELTMAAGYLDEGKQAETATFDLYYRRNPFRGGYAIAAGLEDPCKPCWVSRSTPTISANCARSAPGTGRASSRKSSCATCRHSVLGHNPRRARGTVSFQTSRSSSQRWAAGGADRRDVLLCHINFQTLVATKAARMWKRPTTHPGRVGLRRAQGARRRPERVPGGLISAGRRDLQLLGAATLGIPVKGRMPTAGFRSSVGIESFRAFALLVPEECVLLVDTYDTLKSASRTRSPSPGNSSARVTGWPDPHRQRRLAFLSQRARELLDGAGLPYVKILASTSSTSSSSRR